MGPGFDSPYRYQHRVRLTPEKSSNYALGVCCAVVERPVHRNPVFSRVYRQLSVSRRLYTYVGMVHFIGSGAADYLDFVGLADDPDVVERLLAATLAARGESRLL
jgi:hypothetical protein